MSLFIYLNKLEYSKYEAAELSHMFPYRRQLSIKKMLLHYSMYFCICICSWFFICVLGVGGVLAQTYGTTQIGHGRTVFSDALRCQADHMKRAGVVMPQLYINGVVDATQDHFDPYGNGQYILYNMLTHALNIAGLKPITEKPILNSYSSYASQQYGISFELRHFERYYPPMYGNSENGKENFLIEVYIQMINLQDRTVLVDYTYTTKIQAFFHDNASMKIVDMAGKASSIMFRPYNIKLVETILQRLFFKILVQLYDLQPNNCGYIYESTADPFYELNTQDKSHSSYENTGPLARPYSNMQQGSVYSGAASNNDTSLTTSSINRAQPPPTNRTQFSTTHPYTTIPLQQNWQPPPQWPLANGYNSRLTNVYNPYMYYPNVVLQPPPYYQVFNNPYIPQPPYMGQTYPK